MALSGLLTKGKSFKSCAIVGNAGHLNNSAYGQYIDNHEAVLRFNVLPVGGFEVRPGIIHVNQARYHPRQSANMGALPNITPLGLVISPNITPLGLVILPKYLHYAVAGLSDRSTSARGRRCGC